MTDRTPLRTELWVEGAFLILAGSGTSAITMCATLFYLTRYPDAYERLKTEIRNEFSSIDEIRSGPTLESCVYLSACIDESMRLSPPTPRAPWREVKRGGIDVDGEYIPEGYDVGTSIYSIQHKEEYFPKAYTFVPEHWIPGGLLTQEEIERAHEAMHPFFNWASRLYRPIHGYATNQARYHSDNVAL